MRLLLIILLSMLFCQCTTQESDPQVIINKVLKASGSAVIEKATIAFDFRDRRYSHFKNGGQFIMTRSWEEDTLGQIMDEITNEGFTRTINGIAKEVADTMAVK